MATTEIIPEVRNETQVDNQQSAIDQIKEELKKEVLAEVEREKLKKEILDELNPKKSKIADLIKHPAFLVLLGFFLSGLLVTLLKARWDSNEWEKQQVRLMQIHRVEQKYGLVEELVKSITESNAADEVMRLSLMGLTWPKKQDEESWRKSKSKWELDSELLEQRIKIYFTDSITYHAFRRMLDYKANAQAGIEEAFESRTNPRIDINEGLTDAYNYHNSLLEQQQFVINGMLLEIQDDLTKNAYTIPLPPLQDIPNSE